MTTISREDPTYPIMNIDFDETIRFIQAEGQFWYDLEDFALSYQVFCDDFDLQEHIRVFSNAIGKEFKCKVDRKRAAVRRYLSLNEAAELLGAMKGSSEFEQIEELEFQAEIVADPVRYFRKMNKRINDDLTYFISVLAAQGKSNTHLRYLRNAYFSPFCDCPSALTWKPENEL